MTGSTILIILGALLTAIGILGGGFELRELKVPRVGRGARLLAFFLGIGLILSQPPLSTLLSQWGPSPDPVPPIARLVPEGPETASGDLPDHGDEATIPEEEDAPDAKPRAPETTAVAPEDDGTPGDVVPASLPERLPPSQQRLTALPGEEPGPRAAEPLLITPAVPTPLAVESPPTGPAAEEHAPLPAATCVPSHSLARFYATKSPPPDQARFHPPSPLRANRISVSHVNVHKGAEQVWRFRFVLGDGNSLSIFVGGQEGQRKSKWLQQRAVQEIRDIEWPQSCARCKDWFLVVLEVICPPPG